MKDDLENHSEEPIIPFGALIEYHPISPRDQSRVHQGGKKVLLGIFPGCGLVAGGSWKGDILVAGCIRYLSWKNQRERNTDQTQRW